MLRLADAPTAVLARREMEEAGQERLRQTSVSRDPARVAAARDGEILFYRQPDLSPRVYSLKRSSRTSSRNGRAPGCPR